MHQAETAGPPPEVSQPRRRRWRLWVGIPLAVLFLWLAIFAGLFLYGTDRALREAVAAAERDSPGGWQLADLEAQREQVPDEENAALVVMKVQSLLPAAWQKLGVSAGLAGKEEDDSAGPQGTTWVDQVQELPPQLRLSAELRDRLQAGLSRAVPARVEARKLIGMTRGRFPLVWETDLLQTILHSAAARSAADLLGYEAMLAAEDGGAVALVRGLVATARAVGDEPLLISAIIRLSCNLRAAAVLERVLAQGEPSPRELAALQALLEKEAAEPVFVRAMRGERALMHQTLLNLRNGDVGLAQVTGSTASLEKGLVNLTGPTLARSSHGRMLQLLNESVEASQLPLEEQPAAMKALNQKVIQAKLDYDIITSLMMPATIKVSEANRRAVGNLRCAVVALALERYRCDRGQWPDTLQALASQYLAAVPTDPQDGKPLRYRRRPDGVLVYWIGLDGTDDGGKLDRRNAQAKGTDEGFQLWDVNRRRQAVPEVLPPPRMRVVP